MKFGKHSFLISDKTADGLRWLGIIVFFALFCFLYDDFSGTWNWLYSNILLSMIEWVIKFLLLGMIALPFYAFREQRKSKKQQWTITILGVLSLVWIMSHYALFIEYFQGIAKPLAFEPAMLLGMNCLILGIIAKGFQWAGRALGASGKLGILAPLIVLFILVFQNKETLPTEAGVYSAFILVSLTFVAAIFFLYVGSVRIPESLATLNHKNMSDIEKTDGSFNWRYDCWGQWKKWDQLKNEKAENR